MNTVYELYCYHPAIDFVGYLESGATNYLIFMQLSLSVYSQHKKLCGILSNTPKKIFCEQMNQAI